MVDIVIGEGKVQRQQQDALEQLFGAGQARCKSQPRPLVHGLAAPGKRRADLVRLQESAQLVAPLRLDLVILKNIEVIRIVRRAPAAVSLAPMACRRSW